MIVVTLKAVSQADFLWNIIKLERVSPSRLSMRVPRNIQPAINSVPVNLNWQTSRFIANNIDSPKVVFLISHIDFPDRFSSIDASLIDPLALLD